MGQKASASALEDQSLFTNSDSFLREPGPRSRGGNRGYTRDSRRRSWFRRSACLVPGASRKRRRAAREAGCDGEGATVVDSASLEAAVGREGYLRRLGIRQGKGPKATRMPSPRLRLPNSEIKCEIFEEESEHRDIVKSESSEISMCSQVTINSGYGAELCAQKSPELVIGVRSQNEQARMKFLQKLSYERVWIPKAQRPPSHQNLIIFDWDDTLMCTSFMRRYGQAGLQSTSQPTLRVLQAIEAADYKLLELALSLGQTFIITNAIDGWVEGSASAWAPSLLPLLQKVNVVSARSRYEAEYPHDVKKWKAETFLEIRRQLDSQVITNLVSLGDSEYEMEATQAMGAEFQQATIKLVKFTQHPSPEELLKQLELVKEQFEQIVGSAKSLRVRLQRSPQQQQIEGTTCPDVVQKLGVRTRSSPRRYYLAGAAGA